MHTYDKYWLTNLVRGALALAASAGIAFLPSLLDSTLNRLLFLPFAIALSILCLSLYGILDSSLIVLIGCSIPKGKKVHRIAILQGSAAVVLLAAVTIFSVDGLNLRFFTFFAAFQALSIAFAELSIAIYARHHEGTDWLRACAGISLTCCVALLLGWNLPPHDQAVLIFWYLLLRGISLSLLSLRMLYMDESPSHRHGVWNAMTGGLRTKREAVV
jgi:hypothetical protein